MIIDTMRFSPFSFIMVSIFSAACAGSARDSDSARSNRSFFFISFTANL